VGAAQDVECLLKIAVSDERPAPGGEPALLPGCAMVACSSTAAPGRADIWPRSTLEYAKAASASLDFHGRVHRSMRRAGDRHGPVFGLGGERAG